MSHVVVVSRVQRKDGLPRARIVAGGCLLLVSALVLFAGSGPENKPSRMAMYKSFVPLPPLPPLSAKSSQSGPSSLPSDATPLEVGWQDLPKMKALAFDSRSGPLPVFSEEDTEGTTTTQDGGILQFKPLHPPAMPRLSWHSKTDEVARQQRAAQNERRAIQKWQHFEQARLLHPHHPPVFPNLATPAKPSPEGPSPESMAAMSGNLCTQKFEVTHERRSKLAQTDKHTRKPTDGHTHMHTHN